MSGVVTETACEALTAVPSIPRDGEGPVFRQPWEAQVFAMTLGLYQKGLFTWLEWADTLAAAIKSAQQAGDPDTGETYYHHWLVALERIVAEKGATNGATLRRYQGAWRCAANRTPHGTAIVLGAGDFEGKI